uniref:ATP-dependent RNA helicase n=1 Tax=Albugo laibachii Nc14 TaxID=890382 RepID=F0VZ90_9STRA|nr:DEAD/DEAH box RNA helicase putative [Albugo laibachii Nc14]|eukprot:CCA14120.1 DEAD/DEAH box RNA helicase putative [Albugo laibachii Nc14]
MEFRQLQPPLCKAILDVVEALEFTHTTPVQSSTIPHFLTGKDVCVNACTGSGKTLAFLLPLAQTLYSKIINYKSIHIPTKNCNTNPKVVAMILSPTRELAKQIHSLCEQFFTRVLPQVFTGLFVGGNATEMDLQRIIDETMGKCLVMVGTPGRILDIWTRFAKKNTPLNVEDFEMLILDEADTLLDLGFKQEIDQILQYVPKQRRTGLFSATQTQEVRDLARAGLRNPIVISVQVESGSQQVIPTTLNNYYVVVEHDQRLSVLVKFLSDAFGIGNPVKDEGMAVSEFKCIVFISTCAAVDFFGTILKHLPNFCHVLNGTTGDIVLLHGKMVQKKRVSNYKRFQEIKSGVLICTDVVARGIDLPDVDWILQYDPPQDPNFFVHRIGRTARAGRTGNALSFISQKEDVYINYLRIRKVPCEELPESYGLRSLEAVEDILPAIKNLIIQDRDFLEKGTRAFIAFVRSYKEHQCQFIFRFQDLDLGRVARGFALLQLPKIKEFRKYKISLEPTKGIDISQIKFKDKAREKERQKKLVEYAELRSERKPYETLPVFQKEKGKPTKNPRRREKKKGLHQQIVDEWDELAEEERLYKKFKRGKITENDYEQVLLCKKTTKDEDDKQSDTETTEGVSLESKCKKSVQTLPDQVKKRFQTRQQTFKKTSAQHVEAQKRELRIRQRKKTMLQMKQNLKGQRRR